MASAAVIGGGARHPAAKMSYANLRAFGCSIQDRSAKEKVCVRVRIANLPSCKVRLAPKMRLARRHLKSHNLKRIRSPDFELLTVHNVFNHSAIVILSF